MLVIKIKRIIVGIVGGLGPETTSDFYLDIIRKFRGSCSSYPSIIIDSVSFPFYLEKDIIQDSRNEDKLLPFLKESIGRLNRNRVDFIVIPCNTTDIFIDELRRESSAPILSIIDEVIRVIKERNYKKVGVLATTKTIDSKLYEIPMEKNNIQVIIPEEEQKEVAKIIVRILKNKTSEEDREFIEKTIENLIGDGSEAIVLGCTDLHLVLRNCFDVPVLDSMKILADSTFEKLIGGELK